MRRLVIAVCAVVFATVTQAASITWGAAAGNPGWDPSAEGQYAYLLYTGNSSVAIASTIQLIAAGDVGDTLIGLKADNGGTIVAAYQLNADDDFNGTFATTFSRADADGGVNGYYQILFANRDNTMFAVAETTSPVSGITDMTSAGVTDYNLDWGLGDEYVGKNGFTGAFATTEPVPEPTSGLLLLIGVAGLALRRRRV